VRHWSSILAVMPALAGCRTAVEVPESPPARPIVEGMLVADTPNTVFRLVWSDPPVGFLAANPIPASQVDLELVGPTGRAALRPLVDSAGYFAARLPIERGARYQLSGTVADRTIHAETVVPTRFDVAEPTDPIHLVRQAAPLVPFSWTADGAPSFFLRGARFRSTFRINARSTTGELLLDPPAAPGIDTVEILAVTREVDQYLFALVSPRSNIEGGFGFLGGAIAVWRLVEWE